MSQIEPYATDSLLQDIRRLIDDTRTAVATTINTGLTLLYWQIGRRINADILEGERAPYGERSIVHLAEQLTLEYGQSFVEKNLRRMVQFASVYPDEQIVVSLIRHLRLKPGCFRAAYKGQMELYLRWLERYEMEAGEELPLGLILCAEGAHETIELLRLDAAGIRVAEYLTELPPEEILARKLHTTMQHARARLAQREQGDV